MRRKPAPTKEELAAETRRRFDQAFQFSGHETLHDWADAAGISWNTFYDLRTARRIPHVDTALKIAKAASTSVEMLWGHLVVAARYEKKKSPAGRSSEGEQDKQTTHERTTASDKTEG